MTVKEEVSSLVAQKKAVDARLEDLSALDGMVFAFIANREDQGLDALGTPQAMADFIGDWEAFKLAHENDQDIAKGLEEALGISKEATPVEPAPGGATEVGTP